MYEKLDKIRDDLKRARKRRDDAQQKVKQLENRLKEAENLQIIADVEALKLTPEQLAEFLKMMTGGNVTASVQDAKLQKDTVSKNEKDSDYESEEDEYEMED